MRLAALCLISCLVLAACGERVPSSDPATERELAGQGTVVGFAHDGAWAWRGVPYAAAPEGDLRWRAPRPAPAFNETFEALSHSARCPQLASGLDRATGIEAGTLLGNEDCLKIDIYAPEGAGPESADRPVVMWIHGGGNVWGYAAQYDGAALAREQDAVVAVIQYRLGPLGFFAHPALREDSQSREDGAPEDGAANFALLDMIAALNWLGANAEQFGGDASNITIFGESAGGHDVAGLLASPLAEGLFHRAIIQSGSFDSVSLAEAEGREGDLANPSLAAADNFTQTEANVQAMRAASLADIFAAYDPGEGAFLTMPRMIEDGISLPEGGLLPALEDPETFNVVPVITGVNRDEMKLFNLFDERLVETRFRFWFRPRDPDLYDAASDYPSRAWRIAAVDEAAETLRAGGHEDVWAYRFDWDEGGSFLGMDTARLLGAAHSMEIPFIFNHFDFFGPLDRILFNRANADGREALAGTMGRCWAEFAHSGEPGGCAGTEWTRWTQDGALMRFDSPEGGGPEMIAGVDALDALAADLADDPRVTDAERCAIARSLDGWRAQMGEVIADRLDCQAG